MILDFLYNEETGELRIPRGRPKLTPLVVNLSEINTTEIRIRELATANPMTLPDLITVFNIAIIRLGKIIAAVSLEKREAEQELEEATSIAMLDRVEEFLAKKNVKSTADARTAAVTLDPDVKVAKQSVDVLTVILELMENKHKGLEMAYYSAKKICDIQLRTPDNTNYGGDYKGR